MPASYDYGQGGWASEIFEVLASLAAIALAVCGLTGILAPILAAAATIVLGVALAADGVGLLRRYKWTGGRDEGAWSAPLRFAVLVAGLMGAALAVFALFGADPAFLMPVASALFGAGLILRSNVVWELSLRELAHSTKRDSLSLRAEAAGNDAAVFALAGFVSGALASIAAAGGPNDLTLNLVAIVVAASTLVLWSRVAMAVAARLLQPTLFIRRRTPIAR
ncbi:hypothetical protein WOC76_20110 [Methylocystis sp. IM3]|uniref:hypothetical protein n=1 Tax=unclassified Methylocystis TaxID=2625913 RepID=UPI0030F54F5C